MYAVDLTTYFESVTLRLQGWNGMKNWLPLPKNGPKLSLPKGNFVMVLLEKICMVQPGLRWRHVLRQLSPGKLHLVL